MVTCFRSSNPIVGVTLPNDVYLSYSILILSSAMRISVFPLTLRSESPHETPAGLLLPPTSPSDESPAPKSIWLSPTEGPPPPFVSALTPEPYQLPPILTPSGLQNIPKLVLSPSAASKEIVLTPDVIRYLATASRNVSSQVRDIQVAFRAAEIRVQLQKEELRNLTTAARTMNEKVEKLKGPNREGVEARIKRMQETQKDLQTRLDRLLTALMKKASPELSEHETKWFEELKRMKQEVLGVGKYDDGSLVTKAKRVRYFS